MKKFLTDHLCFSNFFGESRSSKEKSDLHVFSWTKGKEAKNQTILSKMVSGKKQPKTDIY